MKKRALLVLCSVVIAGLLTWQLCWSREARAASAYKQATLGQSEAEIVAAAGQPDETLPCGEFLWWNGDQFNPPKNDGRCVKWVRYNFFLGAYAFGYSADGRLVSRYQYQSE
jgi:hypothetical protein